MFPFTTVGNVAIILLWLCHVWLCACGCNSICVCLSDFAICGSYKPIQCRVAEIQIDLTSNLSSQLPYTNTPRQMRTYVAWSKNIVLLKKGQLLFKCMWNVYFFCCLFSYLILFLSLPPLFNQHHSTNIWTLLLWTGRMSTFCHRCRALWELTRTCENKIVYS